MAGFMLTVLMAVFIFLLLYGNCHAYLDPGAVGSIYQFGYIVFYAVLGFFIILFKPIKFIIMKIFRIKEKPEHSEESGEPAEGTETPSGSDETDPRG